MKIYKVLGISLLFILIGVSTFFIVIQPRIVAHQKEIEDSQLYQTGINLIKQGKWTEARDSLWELNYKDSDILCKYAYEKGKYDAMTKDGIDNYFPTLDIPSDYSGEFANDIKSFKEQIEDKKTLYGIVHWTPPAPPTPSKPIPPQIGMTADQLLASSWGKPDSVNRTTTAYSVSEQWVYMFGYVYVENGIVTAIQN